MPRHVLRNVTGYIVPLVVSLVLAGCGTNSPKVCNLSGNCCPPGTACVIHPGAEFLYATSSAGQVLGFAVDHSTGALSTPTSISGPTASLGMAASGFQFLYVSDIQNQEFSGYSINPTSGALSALIGSPFSTGTFSAPGGLVGTPTGEFLYLTDAGGVDAYNVATGVPSAIGGSPFPSGSGVAVAVPLSGKFLFETDIDPPGGIRAFTIDAITGALAAVPGSPFAFPGQTVANSLSFGIATDPFGNFVYANLNATNQVAAFSVDQTTGALSPVPGSPFAAGLLPTTLVVANTFLYAMNSGDQTISAYSINPTSGVLTPVNGSPFAAGASAGMVTDSLFQHLYAASPSRGIVAFTIGADGSLSPLAGSPFPANGAALLTIVQMPGTGG
jgi:6-phosphogluconolactonase